MEGVCEGWVCMGVCVEGMWKSRKKGGSEEECVCLQVNVIPLEKILITNR